MEISQVERQAFRKIISNPETLAVNLTKVSADDFQNRLAKVVIGALSENGHLAHFSPNKNFFELLLRDRIKDTGELERVSLVLEKMSSTPEDSKDLELLIREIKANRMCREMTRIIQDSIEHITPERVEKTYEGMVRDLLRLPLSAATGVSVSTIREVHEHLEERMMLYNSPTTQRFPTGISAFDDAIGGFAPGEFAVITAGTGQGKSNLLLWWAEQYVKAGANVMYVSIEMAYEQNMVRYHALATGFDVNEIANRRIPEGRLGEYYRGLILHAKEPECRVELAKKLKECVEQTNIRTLMEIAKPYPNRKNKMFFVDIGAASPTRIEREVQRIAMDHKIDYVFVDFINVMDPEFHNRDKVKELASIARDLKKVARRTKTILFTAAQLDTTSIEGKQDEVIHPDRVKYAKAIAENADWMIAFHRTEEDKRLKQIRLQMAKHRMASDVTALIEFDFATMQAVDLGKYTPLAEGDAEAEMPPLDKDKKNKKSPEDKQGYFASRMPAGGWTQEIE